MSTKQRILALRLADKVSKRLEYAKQLGIEVKNKKSENENIKNIADKFLLKNAEDLKSLKHY